MNKIKILSIFTLLILASSANAQKKSQADLKEVVRPFYTQCLTVNSTANTDQILGNLLAENFESVNSAETKTKAQLMGQVKGFWKLIPDLKWEIQEMIQSGNQVVVRSFASGSPKGNFMGMELDGSKPFKIMTTDIHTVENGKIVRVHHIEEWATAMKQLKSDKGMEAKTMYVEIGKMKLKAGVTDEQFIEIERNIRKGIISKQKGFISREFGKDADGYWHFRICWKTKEDGDAWTPVFMQDTGGQALMNALDFSSVRQEHYTVINP